jgi:Tfp pilus assembly protein PilO
MRLPIRRIVQEKRRLVVPIAAALVINLVLLAAVVYPLRARVRSTEARAQTASLELGAAQRDDAAARGIIQGRDKTDAALKAFYKDVLPGTFSQARDTTFLRLTQIAEQHNLQPSRRSSEPETDDDSSLVRMRISISLSGNYEDIRQFIYQVESGTDFIVIDSVALRQGVEAGSPLTLDLTLSTYYRAGTNGA